MPRTVQIFQTSDFSGGINLRDDAYQMRENDLKETLNMIITPQGGIERRPGYTRLNTTAFANDPFNIWTYYGSTVNHILVQVGNDAAFSTGSSTFTAINPDATATSGPMRGATMTEVSSNFAYSYVQRNAEQVAWRWDGSAAALTLDPVSAGYNEDLAAPGDGIMPVARYLAVHMGFMFCAYIDEGANVHRSRIRWSHPGQPTDYRALDFIDVGQEDGDVITGLASFGDALFIFKNRSVWVLTGYDTDTWQVENYVNGKGAIVQEAVSVGRYGVAFFDELQGVFLIQSRSSEPKHLWSRIAPAIQQNITYSAVTSSVLGWLDDRLFVSVDWTESIGAPTGPEITARTFVFDPLCGKEGAWYTYDYRVTAYSEFRTGSELLKLGVRNKHVVLLDNSGEVVDSPGITITAASYAASEITVTTAVAHGLKYLDWIDVSGVDPAGYNGHWIVTEVVDATHFKYGEATDPGAYVSGGSITRDLPSYFQTAWFAVGRPGVRKRWRRPTFVIDNDVQVTLNVKVYSDYSNVSVARQFSVLNQPQGGGMVWGVDDWGEAEWGQSLEGEQAIKRGSGIGRAYVVQLRFEASLNLPDNAVDWALNAIDLRYIMQRIR